MSFFCNFQSDKCPGQITGNPLNGLCEKVCIEAKKVFDACMQQTQLNDIVLELTDYTPEKPTYPLTFISAKSTISDATISDLLIEPLKERQNSARVKCNVTIPVSVAYTDAEGKEGVGISTVTISKDVILCIPNASIMPYTIEAVGNLVSTVGKYTADGRFTIDCCISVILKVVMDVELLVPSYGYTAIPPCQDYTEEVCQGFFELPIYPE